MTDRTGFLERMKALPILFPLVGLFHFVMMIFAVVPFAQQGVLDSPEAVNSIGHWLVYGVIWLALCYTQSRWLALAYILLSAVEILLQYLGPETGNIKAFAGTLFPFNILLCFFLLVYYKRFR